MVNDVNFAHSLNRFAVEIRPLVIVNLLWRSLTGYPLLLKNFKSASNAMFCNGFASANLVKIFTKTNIHHFRFHSSVASAAGSDMTNYKGLVGRSGCA